MSDMRLLLGFLAQLALTLFSYSPVKQPESSLKS